MFAFSLVLLVSLPDGIINPSKTSNTNFKSFTDPCTEQSAYRIHFCYTGIAGLAVTYGLNLNVQQASVIWNICNAENKMISVERILQYSKLTSEAPLVIEECRPQKNWPVDGTICFKNLQV